MRGFARVSIGVPRCHVADPEANGRHMLTLWQQAHEQGSALVVFPELGLSAYTSRDLLSGFTLQEASLQALHALCRQGADLSPLAVVGLPLRVGSALFNVAAAIQGGRVLGLVPKTYLPNSREFEEARWFRPGSDVPAGATARVLGRVVPFGTDLLFYAAHWPDLVLGLEVCEDYWVHVPPSVFQVSAGATVVANLSASNVLVGKADLRRLLARSLSDRGKCAYLYSASGPGESSTDLAFDADAFVCENGRLLAESQRFSREDQLITCDVDLAALVHERITTTSFGDCSAQNARPFRRVVFDAESPRPGLVGRPVAPHPFLPGDPATLATRCEEIFEIQQNALLTRLNAVGSAHLLLGLSGGLDSTQAALVCASALDLAHRPRTDLLCVTMPGLGTTSGTRHNAGALAHALGARLMTLSVAETSRLVLGAMGHPAAGEGVDTVDDLVAVLRKNPGLADTAVENVQARLRTLVLMSLANLHRGMVVGTGDLSEKALGWATYDLHV